ncbi:primase-helicase family protein [Haloferula sp. BvORR071]|uniref:primase-helicase family protein n=1 Tax=Haloferula sp. BvORR071 TaxID=1396141 RepID=UPI00055947C6|nr:primase-helicase family protein [Haloferula sp. BvORR071]
MYDNNNQNDHDVEPQAEADASLAKKPNASPEEETAHDGDFEIAPPEQNGRMEKGAVSPEDSSEGTRLPIARLPAEDHPLNKILKNLDKKLPKKQGKVLKDEDVAEVIRDFFYGAKEYQFRTPDGRFIPLCGGDVRVRVMLDLVERGYTDDELKAAVTDAIIQIQNQHSMDSVLSAAGFSCGLHQSPSGDRVLIPSEASAPDASPGNYGNLHAFIVRLLGDEQATHLYGVLSVFARHMRSIRADQNMVWARQPLPAVAFAGPKGCGKTLLLALVARMFGQRTANPYRYFKGETRFNSELISAEVLVIDDEMAAKDHKTRDSIAQSIKQWMFSNEVRVEKKYCNPVMMPVHSLLMFALNDGNLLCLPTLDESMGDKISLLKVQKVDGTFPVDPEAKDEMIDLLFSEVPHLLHYLLEEHQIKESERNHRTRIAAYQHPELLEALNDLSPETELMEILCEVLKDRYMMKLPDTTTERILLWKGKSFKLHQLLEASSKVPALRLRQLLTASGDLGTRLWHLHSQYPEIVRRGAKSKGVRTYELHLNEHDILRFMPELEEEMRKFREGPDGDEEGAAA